jgi:hypothetical protein
MVIQKLRGQHCRVGWDGSLPATISLLELMGKTRQYTIAKLGGRGELDGQVSLFATAATRWTSVDNMVGRIADQLTLRIASLIISVHMCQ